MHFFRKAFAISAFTILCYPSFGVAATTASISLQDAIRATLEKNPQLAGYSFRVKALDGERQTAGLRPALNISGDLENVAGSGTLKGTDSSELTISLSSVVELGGKRDARLELVTARQQQLESEQRVSTLDVLTSVTHQFIQLVTAQEQLALQKDASQLAQKTLQSLTRLVQAGRTPDAELLRGKAALARAEIALQQAEQNVRNERLKLSAFWADPTPDFMFATADIYALPPTVALSYLQDQLSNNPDLLLLADIVKVRAANVRQARTGNRPDLTLSAGVRRLQESGDSAMVVGLSVPLGSGRRATGAITTASAEQQSAELEHDSTRIQLQAELTGLFEQHQQALNELNTLRTQVLPALKSAQRTTAEGFAAGRYSYLELNLAQNELLDAQEAFIEAASRVQQTRIELERLTGSALSQQNVEVTP